MSEKEYTRLVRLVTLLFGALAFFVIFGSFVVAIIFVKVQDTSKKIDALTKITQVAPIDGTQGPMGTAGIAGIQGERGYKGDKGDIGPTGQTGAAGVVGPQGSPGKQGETGKTGRTGPAAKQLEMCYQGDGVIGQRYTGDTICQPIEGGQ